MVFDAAETSLNAENCHPRTEHTIRRSKMTDTTTPSNPSDSVVAVFPQHSGADKAVKELKKGGFDVKKLSIVGSDYHSEEDVVGFYNTGDRMKYWGKTGALWGGIWGLLFGWAFLLVPGIGPIVVAGPIVAWVIAALEGAVVVGGVSALGAGLYSLGVPKDSIVQYETALKAGKFLLIAHGTADEVQRARNILQESGGADMIDVHQPAGQSARVA
jgi:hypothetical protein